MKAQGILANLHEKLSAGTAFPMTNPLTVKGHKFLTQVQENGPGALAVNARPDSRFKTEAPKPGQL